MVKRYRGLPWRFCLLNSSDKVDFPGSGNDIISTGSGDDTIYGGDDNDILQAGAGNDQVFGGDGDDIVIPEQDHYEIQRLIDGSIPTIYDAPWPNFTPDLLSIVLVTAIQSKGSVLIHQKMFESRLFFVDKLKDMGAQITLCDPHRAVVIGMNRERNLRGIMMSSPDIRAGVALLIAALSADGTSRISNIQQIDRGYQFIDDRLKALGAHIERR